jgi:hypothetical protein
MFIVVYDPNGNVICATSLPSGGDDENGIALDQSGYVYVGGDFAYNVIIPKVDSLIEPPLNWNEYFFVAKYNCGIKLTGLNDVNPTSHITVYPNPSTGSFYFSGLTEGSTIEVYDMMGRSVLIPGPSPREKGGTAVVDLSGRAAGVYFYRVSGQGVTVQQGKLVVE